MKTILALDQSTSSSKALLYSVSGELIDKTANDHQQHYPQPGWVEHDAEEIYRNSLAALRTLLDRNPAAQRDLVCLSITNQRETIVVFDKATGRPLHHAIVWQCRRGEAICKELIAEGHNAQVQQMTGLKIDTYFPAAKLKWLFDNYPGIKQQITGGNALIGTIDTYLIYRLTNGRCFATDHTNACRTLLYDIGQLQWDQTLGDLFDVPVDALPTVRESSAIFDETDLNGHLKQPIPICGVMGDSQAALFAERCFYPGMAKVTFGTGSSVLLNIGDRLKLSDSGIVTTLGWVLANQPTYAFEGIINFTGATLTWLRDQLELITESGETAAMAQSVPDNGGVYLVPAFVGLSAPYWRPNAKGAIVGLTPSATRNHVARAALEAIAYRVRDVLGLMARDSGMSPQYIHGDGGAVSNRFLMQFVADITRYTIRASQLAELSALGAVMSGMLGTGIAGSLEDLEQLAHQFEDYSPILDEELAQEYYAGWQRAVQMVL